MFTGLLVVLALAFLVMKFGWKTIKRIIGANVFVDIVATIFFVWLFGITGTISGMMTGIYAGLIISVILYIAQMLLPHQKLVKVDGKLQWVDKSGEWTDMVKNYLSVMNPIAA